MAERRRRGPARSGDKPVTRALDRGLRILEVLADEPGLPLADIASETDLSPATALRLLDTLRAREFVAHNGADGTYRIGLKAFEVGSRFLAHTRLQETCRPLLQRLAEDTGQTVSLAILEQAEAVYVDSSESNRSIRTTTRVGTRAPAHASASGKVLLAWLWEARVEEIVGTGPYRPLTPNTITDRGVLVEELGDVRQNGIAFDREEFDLGISCLAAPVRDRSGDVVAAISLSSLSSQLAGREAAFASALQQAASDASLRLGWRAPAGGSAHADASLPLVD
ncbi:MAG: IclR family transcriptional regulator [Roseitalea sp.]|jgi:IclR family acetate operon transcriptional repressor|nr:IclR family transcriptional regulator [Roseitalea sp.]MBO6720363.1 IclR family transcriptional regulator [Roseitalea sp.]MBO6742723.1 IclR family transcriptional regulator [Roseitalea sp.]